MLAHSGEKLHKCMSCNTSWGRAGDLRDHMLTHTGEKPHSCTEDSPFDSHWCNTTNFSIKCVNMAMIYKKTFDKVKIKRHTFYTLFTLADFWPKHFYPSQIKMHWRINEPLSSRPSFKSSRLSPTPPLKKELLSHHHLHKPSEATFWLVSLSITPSRSEILRWTIGSNIFCESHQLHLFLIIVSF